MKKRAFTLIELLAVIVILAVIAIISTPIVLNVIENAKEKANLSTVNGMIDGARLYYGEAQLDDIKMKKINNIQNIYDDIMVQGDKPTNGKLYVNKKGMISLSIVIDNKCYYQEFAKDMEIRDKNNCDLGFVEIDTTAPEIKFRYQGEEGSNGWYTSNIWVTIDISDQESGLSGYSWCQGKNCTPDNDETATQKNIELRDNNSTFICVTATDKRGNTSNDCSKEIKIDTIIPILSGISDIAVTKDDFVDLTLGVTAEDSGSGIEGTFIVTPMIVDTSSAGIKEITYTTSDFAGNSRTLIRKIFVDANPPTIRYQVLEESPNNGWYPKEIYVTATIQDNSGTGIQESYTCVSTTSSECDPSVQLEGLKKSFYLTMNGNNRMCIKTIDNNHKETTLCSDTYKLDTVSPSFEAINTAVTITKGDNIDVSTYFTHPIYGSSGEGSYACNPINTSELTTGDHTVSCTATSVSGLTTTKSKDITVKAKPYMDNSGASYPELADKMLPVIWNGSDWVIADIANAWYDYDTKQWANAIVLNNGITKKVGQTITESEIAMMYVWVPRYEYKLPGASFGTTGIPNAIDIKFIDKKKTTADIGYNLHPGFTFGDDHKNGIWIGKFETSTSGDPTANTAQPITIKPNVIAWTNKKISAMFGSSRAIESTYGLTGVDAHVTKYTEWSAVSYFANSIYGRCSTATSCTEVSRNNSSGYYTGRSDGTSGSGTTSTVSGTYLYDTIEGQLASTTGNIYGIYDMSGGAREIVMGFISGTLGLSGFYTAPESKYYDGFTVGGTSSLYSDLTQYNGKNNFNGIFKELLSNYSAVTSWYKDDAASVVSYASWFGMGGSYGKGTAAGLFSSHRSGGDASTSDGFRIALLTA